MNQPLYDKIGLGVSKKGGISLVKTAFEQIVNVNKIGSKNEKHLHDILTLAQAEKTVPAKNDKKKILFLGIDFQNDFMENGALGVPGAHKDIQNVTKFIYRHLHKITDIAVSLDTHQPRQIFHPCWWEDQAGNHPQPLTIITTQDIESGKWIPVYEKEESVEYVVNLEKSGKKQLCIWPYHCIEGTYGASLEGQFANIIYFHSVVRRTNVIRMVKGLYPATEMYGIFRPEYSKNIEANIRLLESMRHYDQIIIAGEAKSHCVLESVIQLVEYLKSVKDDPAKIYLLEDGMSSIPGFEDETEQAYRTLVNNDGIHLVTSTEFEL